ncbi:hypothetical protein ANRL2_01332 [Anaerolineae bacterium]|nr:hypothetical protein ANRL2_01332 [Anaerolineae bacterium]
MPMYDHHIAGWVIFLALLILFVIGLFVILRAVARSGAPEGHGKSATDLLNERYARGEVSKDEYLRIKKDILRKE